MKVLRLALLPLLAAALSACGILYTDVKLPRGYRSASPSDVKAAPNDPLVTGRSCSRSALYLVAWGDSSYAAAVQDALKGRDGILYDVRSDMKANAYALGLYTRVCTVLTGKLGQP
ncbi:MAG: hypothetical protein KGM24_11290 [Elusimicrobia bacterium]|nr:hypothetical protein [Elusimicrobiota bacterium]